ncbi:MAG: 2Fe-2S iron-sulfur cluster-binding protein [Proteobacteria bacterium]|nr:2Fe-2S iron-sulfur cluster-binding protein [Pseudomonadota bacterium]
MRRKQRFEVQRFKVPEVIFVQFDGSRLQVTGPIGDTVLDLALDNGVPGILGQCGGGCTCVTCHCYVHAPWFSQLVSPHRDETDMLEYAIDRKPCSRLACQIKLTDALDGMVVSLPETQL